MPSLAAALVASIGSWLIDSAIESFVGFEARLLIGIVDSILIYVFARNWLLQLRDGG